MKELYTAAGIFVVLILLGVWMVQNNRNEQEKKLVQLRKKWGKNMKTAISLSAILTVVSLLLLIKKEK